MPTVFIHGVTVREERFASLLETIGGGIREAGVPGALEGFYWGDVGARLRLNGASIPGFDAGARALDAVARPPTELDTTQLMALLIEDPHLELAMLKDDADFSLGGGGFTPIPEAVEDRNMQLERAQLRVAAALSQDSRLTAAVGRPVDGRAVQPLVAAAFERAAAAQAGLDAAELIDPLTRCLTAALYRQTAPPSADLDSVFNFGAVDEVVRSQLEVELGGVKSILDKMKQLGLDGVTFALRTRYREKIMRSMSLFVGDVLVYLANRDDIQQRLHQTISELRQMDPGPLRLIGHSLGGVIAYDYCTGAQSSIASLITVGSQVGVLEEFGVLKTKEPADAKGVVRLPSQLKRWLNVYDVDDMLSFRVTPVFSGTNDQEVDTRTPFPVSHSAYWNDKRVYAYMAPYLRG